VKVGDEWVFQEISAGPEKPKEVMALSSLPCSELESSEDLLPFVDLLPLYSLAERSDWAIKGLVGGLEASVLIDTGASEYNFVRRNFVTASLSPIYKVHTPVRVKSVHGFSTVHEYTIFEVVVKYGLTTVTIEIPALILGDSPCDIILGLPAITQYDLLTRFGSYFNSKKAELAAKQTRQFSHFNPASESAVFEMSGVDFIGEETSVREAGELKDSPTLTLRKYPYPRAPMLLPHEDARAPDSTSESLQPHGVDIGQQDVISGHPPYTYTVTPKEELLDNTVAPDEDSMQVDSDPPDPLASESAYTKPVDLVELFGSVTCQKKLKRLINRYPHIFAISLDKTPLKTKPFSFYLPQINLWKESKQSKQQPRPLSHDKEIALEKWISAALAAGIISRAPAVANWSQIILVLKPNREDYRFCVDYTLLNTFMESAGWPIPHIGSILRRIASKGPAIFATMDATQGFYQAEIELSSQEFLCFTTYLGNFMWNRAPMGPKTVPALFQRAMCVEVFPDLVHKIMEVYIDDFIVWAQNEDELITRLEEVFKRCSEMNLKLNPKKCRFGMDQVEYCGHIINKDGVTFSPERINEVAHFQQPQNFGELKSFLGMAGYMREHVPHYVDLVNPLNALVRHYKKPERKRRLEWTPESTEAFVNLKKAISDVYLLYHRDPTGKAPIRLYTDASTYGIGAYLCQVVTLANGKIEEQPLGFISKSLSDTEKRWSVYEKEAFAIYYACKKWEHYLRGYHFHLFTDHKNLTFLNRPPSEKVMRWRLAIQELDFSVAHIEGSKNNVADALSRCIDNPDSYPTQGVKSAADQDSATLSALVSEDDRNDAFLTLTWMKHIEREQRTHYFVKESELTHFLGLLTTDDTTDLQFFPEFRSVTQPSVQDTRMGLPSSLEESYVHALVPEVPTTTSQEIVQNEQAPLHHEVAALIERCHNTKVGHGGVDRTLYLLNQLKVKDKSTKPLFDQWTCQRADVRRFVKTCPICQKVKQHQLLKYTPHFSTSTYGIFDNVSIDTIYMPESARGHKYLLVLIDSFSRYLDVYPIHNLTAEQALACFTQFSGNFGIPSHLCCDNGTQFYGIFREFMALLNVNHFTTQEYSHQENSIVERANKEILTTLRALVLERRLKDDWDILCHVAKRIINSRVHSAIGIAPADLVFAGRIDLQRGSLFPYPTPESFFTKGYMLDLIQQQEIMLQKAFRMQQEHDKNRLKDNNHALRTVFPVDSYVLVKPEREPTSKLAPRLLGPYLVTERFPRGEGDVYRCLHLSTNQAFDFRVDRLYPYFTHDEPSLRDTAMLDNESYEVEAVLGHRFQGTQSAKNLQLQIKWLGYEQPQWQQYSGPNDGLNSVGVVHEYLRRHKFARFIPARFTR
jgi:hypothetical protein